MKALWGWLAVLIAALIIGVHIWLLYSMFSALVGGRWNEAGAFALAYFVLNLSTRDK
jgi:hypothetical protein